MHGIHASLPMNLRPEAAPTFPLPPGEGGPKGRVRERVIWFADAIISLTPFLPMNLRPEAAPTFPLPPGEGGPKGRVRERVIWFADAIIPSPHPSPGGRG